MSFSVLLQRLAPLHLLTRIAGQLADCRQPWLAQYLIRTFVRRHKIDLDEALVSDLTTYPTFNEFFIRALRPGARPIAAADWTSPVDGTISQIGRVEAGQMIHAKQHAYSATALLGDAALAKQLEGGCFSTVYLSPRNYHRIHMPCEGRLLGMRHVPGKLYSVRPDIVEGIDGLLAINERLVCWFEHPQHGVFALVLVGAAIVGRIATVWHGLVEPKRSGQVSEWHYADGATAPQLKDLLQGVEMGHFQLGSTIVLLMPGSAWQYHPDWQVGQPVRLGQAIASRG
ncbi:archaetidylserine decarboxylase [Cupriavidus metallidurans]|uniref:archaetidylserine decarboxylase n=1 Tax=Cupriavidus metallidurans TaxID=119219 RepID=UPI0016488C3E|nr:archaetidylserine decarboxylase [Cupriavidus metallidurans]